MGGGFEGGAHWVGGAEEAEEAEAVGLEGVGVGVKAVWMDWMVSGWGEEPGFGGSLG